MEWAWFSIAVFNTSLWAFTWAMVWAYRRKLLQHVRDELAALVIEEIRKQDDRIQRRLDRASPRPPNSPSTEEEQEELEPGSLPYSPHRSRSAPPQPYTAGVSLRSLGLQDRVGPPRR